ncbi:hypothetical protein [Mycobacterium sp.]|uniref:hypothetical protein n=1 Tax=Mycobacterium sp. TaxID=1785 RepID=UPI003F94B481
MARLYPGEFRDDVVRVARNRDDGVTIEQVARARIEITVEDLDQLLLYRHSALAA